MHHTTALSMRKAIEMNSRRIAFGDALATAIETRGFNQAKLAAAMGVSQPTVSDWISGQTEPKTAAVTFEIERVLEVAPGSLSRHLGYLPVEAVADPPTFESVVGGDPILSPDEARGFVQMYRSIIAGRRPKKRR